MRFTLILFDGVSELGRVAIGGVTVAARDQVIPTPSAASIEWRSRPTAAWAASGMKDSQEPRTEIEWSLRAIIFVVGVLAAHMPE